MRASDGRIAYRSDRYRDVVIEGSSYAYGRLPGPYSWGDEDKVLARVKEAAWKAGGNTLVITQKGGSLVIHWWGSEWHVEATVYECPYTWP